MMLRFGRFLSAERSLALKRRLPTGVYCLTSIDDNTLQRRWVSSDRSKTMLDRILYRQLLRWCQDTDPDIPLSSYLPPVTVHSPYVDVEALHLLNEGGNKQYIQDLLPKSCVVTENRISTQVHNVQDLCNFFRAVFRCNSMMPTSEEVRKDRITVAFETMKSLNELTDSLERRRKEREKHLDRTDVAFRVGQVVQHKEERWRGVIVGWERTSSETSSSLTSLTTKSYDVLEGEELRKRSPIQYTIILDSGDAHFLGGRRVLQEQRGFPVAFQDDLELVTDASLCRIRSNWVPNHFENFESTNRQFVPKEKLAYEYPIDYSGNSVDREARTKRDGLGMQMSGAIRLLAARLVHHLLVGDSGPAQPLPIQVLKDRLLMLAKGDLISQEDKMKGKELSATDQCILHLKELLSLSLEVSETLWQRRLALQHKDRIKYQLGDVVQHKKYGFRGVVVAWDPYPSVDVSRWDGLTEIEHPEQYPFYHVVPDHDDSIAAFGGNRPIRYVCEENMQPCPPADTKLNVDLEPEWLYDASNARYIAPEELKFKYGATYEGEDCVEKCFLAVQQSLTQFQLAQRGVENTEAETKVSEIAEKVSLTSLFDYLQMCDNMDAAIAIEESIKEIWKAHPDPVKRWKLDNGIAELLRGNKEAALGIFEEIVDDDPEYAEAWNKAATCHFMMGNLKPSQEAANRTLELQPNHFQALNGLGLVQYESRRYKLAAESFRRSLNIDPWSPVSSRLSACIDLLVRLDMEEDEGSAEGTAPYEDKK